MRVYLGDDRENGRVEEPLAHLAIFGQTRRAGKTTSLRELIGIAAATGDVDVLVFRTGRGEIQFPGAHRTGAYFRERVDWRGVESVIWSYLDEKPQRYRPIVQRACEGARSLADVHRNFIREGKKATQGWLADRTQELDYYFREILPWIAVHHLSTSLELSRGVNLADLEGWPLTVQQLVVGATLDRLMEDGTQSRPLIVVLPEAQKFLPSQRRTPAQRAAARYTSEGAKLGLYLWIDSQALTGVDQGILRHFALVLQGVQTSDLEINRVCRALDGVKPMMVRSLKVGDFILSTQDGVRIVHVPLTEPIVGKTVKPEVGEPEEHVDEKERANYQSRIDDLDREVAILRDQLRVASTRADREHDRAEANAKAAAANAVDRVHASPGVAEIEQMATEAAADRQARREKALQQARERVDLNVTYEAPNLTVKTKVVTIEQDDGDMVGRIGILIADGFWNDGPKRQADAGHEFVRRGYGATFSSGGNSVRLSEAFAKMTLWGFFRKEDGGGYALVPEARARIRVKKEA